MITKKVIIKDPNGLHARPAANIVSACNGLNGKVTISNGRKNANGRSILEILLLEAAPGTELEIVADGQEEEAAINRIMSLF